MSDGYWLVLAFSEPPLNLRMARSRKGTCWWRRVSLKSQVDAITAILDRTSIRWKAEYTDRASIERSRIVQQVREREFKAYQRELTSAPGILIKLDPNRDRSSGRQTYAEYRGNPSREAGANPEQ